MQSYDPYPPVVYATALGGFILLGLLAEQNNIKELANSGCDENYMKILLYFSRN